MKTFLQLLSALLTISTFAVEKPTVRSFGSLGDGIEVSLFSLTNANGMAMDICNYGCAIVRLTAPDRGGAFADVVLGFNTLDEYRSKSPCFGAVVGRFANRIANGKFSLDGSDYALACNSSSAGLPCSIHGGSAPFHKMVWDAEPFVDEGAQGVRMHHLSKDGEGGFPGNLDVTATFRLTEHNELRIDYAATTDKATPVNLSHHGYFNLRGEGRGDVLGHLLLLNADKFTPANKGMIPTGELRPVNDTPFDFTQPRAIGGRINDDDEQIKTGSGYDHNFALNNQDGSLALAAEVFEPASGRVMDVLTTEPGVQFYTANHLSEKLTGKSGRPYGPRHGFCLETQHYPDSPNQTNFPSTIVRPDKPFKSTTIFRFTARK